MTSAEASGGTARRAVAQEYEPWLRERLEWFRDLKFGLFVHWGLYAEWGCTESWPLVTWQPDAEDALVTVPTAQLEREPARPAWVLRMTAPRARSGAVDH